MTDVDDGRNADDFLKRKINQVTSRGTRVEPNSADAAANASDHIATKTEIKIQPTEEIIS